MSYTPKKYDSNQILTDATFSPEDWKDFNVTTITATSGAINLKYDIVLVDTTAGAATATLADGAVGQEMYIKMVTDGGNMVITPSNLRDGSTITLDDVNDDVTLVFDGDNWNVKGTATATVA